MPVDGEGDYFGTVCDYIHLNPARTKRFDLENGKLADYRWSSYPLYMRPSRRPDWLSVERSLGRLGLMDDRSGRIYYQQHLHKRIVEMACSEKPWEVDGQWAKIRRGWCFGSDEFRERMLKELDKVVAGKRRDSFSGEEVLRHDLRAAENLIDDGMEKLKLSRRELAELPKGDLRKQVLAWMVRRRTVVRNEWISQTLCMGSAARLSTYIRAVELAETGELVRLKEMFRC